MLPVSQATVNGNFGSFGLVAVDIGIIEIDEGDFGDSATSMCTIGDSWASGPCPGCWPLWLGFWGWGLPQPQFAAALWTF